MQPELEVRDKLGLVITEMETHRQRFAAQGIGEREGNFERIFFRRDFVRRDAVGERRAFAGTKVRADITKQLVAQETVRPTSNLASAVETVLILQPVQEVAHDGSVIPPPARRFADLVVAIKKTGPIPIRIAPGQTNEFGTVARDDDAQAAVFVRQDVEQALLT